MDAQVTAVHGRRTVLVVDENPLFGELLARAVDAEPGLRGVGHARSVCDAVQQAALHSPDVVVTGLRLAGEGDDAMTLARRLLQADPAVRVAVLTTVADVDLVRRAGAAGVAALLRKDGALDELLDSLRRLERGHLVLQPSLLGTRLVPAQRPAAWEALTSREQQVLELLARGAAPRVIARRLGISVNTCRGYVKSLRLKLGARTQLEAVVVATSRGLVRVGAS